MSAIVEDTAAKNQREQIVAVKVIIWSSIVLFLIAAGAGIAVDSITLVLDAADNLVVILVAFLMHYTIRKVTQPADEFYNFGYSKYEPLTVATQGVLLITTCVVSIKFAIQDIVHPDELHNYFVPLVATLVSLIINTSVALYLKIMAKRTASEMLKEAGEHWLVDSWFYLSMGAGFLAGLFLQTHQYSNISPYVDPVMAIIFALFFIRAPLKTITHNAFELLDAAPQDNIRSLVNKVVDMYKPKAFGVKRLRIRKAGIRIFVEVCFLVKNNLTVSEIEKLSQDFETDLKKHLPYSDVVVYFKPA